jgi:tetratricopeptide (TPR) repeat protein
MLSNQVFANKFVIVPPDSSSSIIDRTAALYLIDEGKKFYNQGKSIDALRKFREAYVRDKYSYKAAYWIGKAHYNMDNYGYALKYAKIAESLSEAADGEVFLLLGEAYHRQSLLDSARMNYDLAKIQLNTSKRNAFNIDQKIEEVSFAQSVKDKSIQYEKVLLSDHINSGYDDYNAVITSNGKTMYFSSRRPDTKGGNINPDDQRYFEDVYKSVWLDSLNDWTDATNDVERLNSDGFDAVGHITSENEAYMTVNTSIIDTKNPTRSSDICTSSLTKEERWNTPKPIKNKTINTSFFDGAPTLTADGNTMYFVSGRNGDKSLSDIFVVYKDGRSWGEAVALPMSVNTLGNETTPFITPDNRYLFFSSDGRKGMGGYDIYVTENLGDTWSEPKNLGPEFNTVNSDTHFKYYKELKKAFLSTYRLQGSKASIDIFEIILDGWKIP